MAFELLSIKVNAHGTATHSVVDGPANVEVPVGVEQRREGKVQEALHDINKKISEIICV